MFIQMSIALPRTNGAAPDSTERIASEHPASTQGVHLARRAPATALSAALVLFDLDDLKRDRLEGQLLANSADEVPGSRIGFGGCPKLNRQGKSGQLRKGLLHFAIQCEGQISIEFFLELKELMLASFPWTVFIHGHHQFSLTGIVGKGIHDARVFKTAYLTGNHT